MSRPARASACVVLAVLVAACSAELSGEPSTDDAASMEASASQTVDVASPSGTTPASADPGEPADALLAVELTDVRSGETFTLGELAASGGPVLLEPMAVWCSNCRAQQHEVVRAHESGTFSSVSLDVDLSESPEDLAAYADREGFEWHFAMADAELYRVLQDRFGVAATNPPSTPLIIIGADGTVRPLEFGRGTRGAEELLAELAAG